MNGDTTRRTLIIAILFNCLPSVMPLQAQGPDRQLIVQALKAVTEKVPAAKRKNMKYGITFSKDEKLRQRITNDTGLRAAVVDSVIWCTRDLLPDATRYVKSCRTGETEGFLEVKSIRLKTSGEAIVRIVYYRPDRSHRSGIAANDFDVALLRTPGEAWKAVSVESVGL